MKSKYWIATLLASFTLAVTGCSSEESAETEPVTQPDVNITEEKQPEDSGTAKEVIEDENTDEKESIPITKEEFDSKFKRDPDEPQYEGGKTELKDGTVLNVDEIVYSNDESFDYLIATFYEDKLVHLQVETSISTEESLSGIGLSENDYTRIKPSPHMTGIFDVVIDERFADENIAVFPSEWDSL